VIQNKKFDGRKCEDNVSDKTRVIIESTRRGKNVCKTLKRSEKEVKKIHLQEIDQFGDSSQRSHFPRVLNKQHNPPKK
jgi:hypothetical protein